MREKVETSSFLTHFPSPFEKTHFSFVERKKAKLPLWRGRKRWRGGIDDHEDDDDGDHGNGRIDALEERKRVPDICEGMERKEDGKVSRIFNLCHFLPLRLRKLFKLSFTIWPHLPSNRKYANYILFESVSIPKHSKHITSEERSPGCLPSTIPSFFIRVSPCMCGLWSNSSPESLSLSFSLKPATYIIPIYFILFISLCPFESWMCCYKCCFPSSTREGEKVLPLNLPTSLPLLSLSCEMVLYVFF